MSPRLLRAALVALLLLGLGLRLGLAIQRGLNAPAEPGTDQHEYDTYAWNLAEGRGFRGMSPDVTDQDHLTAYRVPGTSLFWAGIYSVVGHNYAAVRVAHCLLGALTVLVVYRIGLLCFSRGVGLLSAGLFAVYPTAVLYATDLLSEPLGTFLFLLHVQLALEFARTSSLWLGLLCGLSLGLSILARANFVLMLPLVVLWGLYQFRRQPRSLVKAVAIPAVAVVSIMPWAVRNYIEFEKFIPLSTAGGSALLQGNNRVVVTEPTLFGYSVWDTQIPEYRSILQEPNDEFERDRRAKELAIAWIKANPDKWLFLIQAKLRRGFTPFLQAHSPALYRWGMLLSWGPVLIAFLLAAVPTLLWLFRNGHPGWIVHLAILSFVINTIIFFGNSRYRSPIEPLCFIVAFGGIQLLLHWLNRGRVPGLLTPPVVPDEFKHP